METGQAPSLSLQAIRQSELFVMESVEDLVVYCFPEIMDSSCDFIYAWDKSRLFELADFTDKVVVLDLGSGSGRLAFAAAEEAKHVYASEPLNQLRKYLRDKVQEESIQNMTVVDGMASAISYPDDTLDIVMSGHVVGDDPEKELREMTRVVKSGGYLQEYPGESRQKFAKTF